jgi:hypothetical protein
MNRKTLKQKLLFGIVSGLFYAIILIGYEYFFKDSISWIKISIKGLVFGIVLTIFLHFINKINNK